MSARAGILGGMTFLAILTAACGTRATPGHDEGVPTCEPGFSTPQGFRQTERFEDPYVDHVGIRLGFVSEEGAEIHYFAGIPGEFGEGLPGSGSVEVAAGLEGPLQGSGRTWVLSWRAPGPCGVRAVLGSGLTRRAFLDTLERAGIVPAR